MSGFLIQRLANEEYYETVEKLVEKHNLDHAFDVKKVLIQRETLIGF
jgi:hypothetical protein